MVDEPAPDPFARILEVEKPKEVDTARAATAGVDGIGGRGLATGVETDCGRGVPGAVEGSAAREALSRWRLLIGNFVLNHQTVRSFRERRDRDQVVWGWGKGTRNKVITFRRVQRKRRKGGETKGTNKMLGNLRRE